MKDEIQKPSTDLVTIQEDQIVAAFKSESGLGQILDRIETEVKSHEVDTDTKKGRAEAKSLAYKVSQSKTLLDQSGMALTERQRAEIEQVNKHRKELRERLDALRDQVRKPVIEWEKKDEERKAKIKERMTGFSLDKVSFEMAADDIRSIWDEALAIDTEDGFDEFQPMAKEAKALFVTKCEADHKGASVREAQEAKIAALEAENAARAEEARKREEADAEAARKAAEAEAEAKRLAAEAAEEQARKDQEEQDRIQQEAFEKERAEQQARDEADRALKEAEAAEAARSQHADSLVKYVEELAKGMIAGTPQPYGILRYELDHKLPGEQGKTGDHWHRVQSAIEAAQSDLDDIQQAEQKAADERRKQEIAQKEEQHAKELAEAEQRARDRAAQAAREEEEARAKRAADQEYRARLIKTITSAMSAFPVEELAEAIMDGKIPHVRIEV